MVTLQHNTLKEFLRLSTVAQRSILYLSIRGISPQMDWVPNLFRRAARREIKHLWMGWKAVSSRDHEDVFIFELYLQHIFLMMPLLSLSKGHVYLSLHWNQQLAMSSPLKYVGLLYLKLYLKMFPKFKAVLFEEDDQVLEERYRLPATAKCVIPMPVRTDLTPTLAMGERFGSDHRICFGISGFPRDGKGQLKDWIEHLDTLIATHFPDSQLRVGIPLFLSAAPKLPDRVELVDTTLDPAYVEFLSQMDILITYYERDKYFYRTSGVMNDAVCSGCYVVAPDYPILAHQISWPAAVGATYEDMDGLVPAISTCVHALREQGQDPHWQWRQQRTAESIAPRLFGSLDGSKDRSQDQSQAQDQSQDQAKTQSQTQATEESQLRVEEESVS